MYSRKYQFATDDSINSAVKAAIDESGWTDPKETENYFLVWASLRSVPTRTASAMELTLIVSGSGTIQGYITSELLMSSATKPARA
jgi:hypothetical protein